MESFRKAFARVDMSTTRPIVLAQMEVRYFTKRLLSFDYPNVVVLSFQELPADVRVQPVGPHDGPCGPPPPPTLCAFSPAA